MISMKEEPAWLAYPPPDASNPPWPPKARSWSRRFIRILAVLITAFAVTQIFLRLSVAWPCDKPKLLLRQTRNFQIGIFSDLHFGEEEHDWGIEQDVNSTRVMESFLRDEDVDLVVLNGDLITGENTFRENSSEYLHQIVRPMVDADVPWASVYGNHDSEFNLSRKGIYNAEKGYELSYTNSMGGDLPGVTNYYLVVWSSRGKGTIGYKPAAILWFFDSRGGRPYQRAGHAGTPFAGEDKLPDWVAPQTAEWFVRAHKALHQQYGRTLPSVAFVHIPPHVFLEAQQAGLDRSAFPGINDDVPLAYQGKGHEDEAFVQALLRAEGLHSVYVGHDHGDSWCSTWPSQHNGKDGPSRDDEPRRKLPFLCFAKHTGYGGYGSWARGARVARLLFPTGDSDGEGNGNGNGNDNDVMRVETWVRMEDGRVVSRVSLNETYGEDNYGPQRDG